MFFNYKAKVVLKATGKEFILKENNKPFLIRQFKNNTISLIIILSEAGLHGPDVTPGPNPAVYKMMNNFLRNFAHSDFLRIKYRYLQFLFENKLINYFFHCLKIMVRRPDRAILLQVSKKMF